MFFFFFFVSKNRNEQASDLNQVMSIRLVATRLGRALNVEDAPLVEHLPCPGGPRLSATHIKYLFGVTNAHGLKNLDLRFILNLKLTHSLLGCFNQSGAEDKLLVELGPGPGSLTRSLLTLKCAGVFGIELEKKYNESLEAIRRTTKGHFDWCNADVLADDEYKLLQKHYPAFVQQHTRAPPLRPNDHADDKSWWSNGEAKVEVVGNLPFVVASNLVMRYAVDCCRQQGLFRFGCVPLHIFLQKEVAERFVAVCGTKQYGRPSVVSQNFFRVMLRKTFTEWTYYPKTKVYGALVTFEPRSVPLVQVDASALINFCDIALRPSLRGRTIVDALKRCVPNEVALYILREVGVDGNLLAVQLTPTELGKMALLWVRFLDATHQAPPSDKTYEHVQKEGQPQDARGRHRVSPSAPPLW